MCIWENTLAGVQDTIYPRVAPRELLAVTSEYVELTVFYTDGSLIEGSAGFAIHQTGVGRFGFKLQNPADVFSAELSALFMTLQHIVEVIQPQERCLILTDSLSSTKAMLSRRISWRPHPLVYECKQLCFDLTRDGIEVKFMWIPSHVGLVANELVDGEARYASLNESIFDRPLFPPKLGKTSLVKGMTEEVGFGRHWQICSLYITGSFTACMGSRVRRRKGALFPLYLG
jgi:ribonuclease HI